MWHGSALCSFALREVQKRASDPEGLGWGGYPHSFEKPASNENVNKYHIGSFIIQYGVYKTPYDLKKGVIDSRLE